MPSVVPWTAAAGVGAGRAADDGRRAHRRAPGAGALRGDEHARAGHGMPMPMIATLACPPWVVSGETEDKERNQGWLVIIAQMKVIKFSGGAAGGGRRGRRRRRRRARGRRDIPPGASTRCRAGALRGP